MNEKAMQPIQLWKGVTEEKKKSLVFTFQCEKQKDSMIIIIFYGLFLYSCFFYCR